MARVIIIGGGISGLTAAHSLQHDFPDIDFLLVESSRRLGGTLGSETVDGFVFERGANGFLDNVPHTLELARELGLDDKLRSAAPEAKSRFIYKKGKLHAVPTSPLSFLRSPLLSLRGRLSVLLEPFRKPPPGGGEDSVANFGRRRLGEEAMRTLLDPLVTGIYAGDIERLSLQSAFPRIAEMERSHGSLFQAMRYKRKEQRAKSPDNSTKTQPAKLWSFAGGMQDLVNCLRDKIGERARLEWRATSVRKDEKGFVIQGTNGDKETANAVILAVPSYAAASLFAGNDPETSRAFESIPHAPIAVICLGFPRGAVKNPLSGYGFLAPRDEGLRVLGSIFVSSIHPEHAPFGQVSLRCMIGGARDPNAINNSDDRLREMVLDELRPLLGLEGEPAPVRIYRYTRGIPQYNIGHRERLDRLERRLWDLPGLFITGNAYYGIGVNDCVLEGRKKARAVWEFFRK